MTGRSFAVTAAFVAACSFSGAKTGHDHADAPRDGGGGGGGGDADAAPSTTCGNGVVEAGEECDDGNTAGSDGCSATCEIEPAWACPGGSACMAVTGLALGSSEDQLAFVGTSTGGGGFVDTCAPGEVIVGFAGELDPDQSHLDQLHAFCSRVVFDGTTGSATSAAIANTPSHGNNTGPSEGSATCGSDELVVGFVGDADQFLSGLELMCAPVSFTHGSLHVGSARTLAMYGPGSTTLDMPEPCGSGEVANRYDGSSGATVDHFGMACAAVAPAF